MADPTDLIATHLLTRGWSDGIEVYICLECGDEWWTAGEFAEHVKVLVEQHTNGRIAELEAAIARVEKLAAENARDAQEHLNTFGQHHPVAGIAHDHLRAALEGEQQ